MLKPRLLHHLRRNRTYARHERWAVVAGLLSLTLMTAGISVFWNSKSQAHAETVTIQSIETPDRLILADGQDKGFVDITLTKAGGSVPAVNTWIGLKVKDRDQASESLIYNGWYSPYPSRAFFSTDARGRVSFPMMSEKAGTIQYAVYIADMVDEQVNGYQKLDQGFVVQYTGGEGE